MTTAGEPQPDKRAIFVTSEPLRKRRHWPRTLEERMALGLRELRVPASFEEFLAFSQECDYRVHYREGHIISFVEIDEKTNAVMGEASVIHEMIVARIIRLLGDLFDAPDSGYHILGSNARIFIAEDQKGCNADVTIVQGQPEQKTYKYNRRQVTGLTNPWLIVEVLSDSTRDFDLSEKLSDYKSIPSLRQVLFLEQDAARASTYIRLGAREWRNLDLTEEDGIPVGEETVSVREIYAGILPG